jgi:uncharacterized protein YdaU (DUF1376 family)
MSKKGANTLNKGKAPAFQFYAADFDMATRGWLPEEVGVYMRLLCAQWITGPLPKEMRRLAAIAGITAQEFEDIWKNTLGAKFEESEDGYLNQRLEVVRKEQLEYRETQSENGKLGAKKRWANHNTNGGANSGANSDANGEGYGEQHGENIALRSSGSGLQTPDFGHQSPNSPEPLPRGEFPERVEKEIGGAHG